MKVLQYMPLSSQPAKATEILCILLSLECQTSHTNSRDGKNDTFWRYNNAVLSLVRLPRTDLQC